MADVDYERTLIDPQRLKTLAAAGVKRLAFAFLATRGAERECLLLAESIRAFGGSLAKSPLMVMVPEDEDGPDAKLRTALFDLDAEIVPFEAGSEFREYPLALKVAAAAEAEERVILLDREGGSQERIDALAWLDPDSFIVREPEDFLLLKGYVLAFRPVHLAIIGSPIDQPQDEFWWELYRLLGASFDAAFPMTTTMDRLSIRPYFNAGLLVVRPEAEILGCWARDFSLAARHERIASLCAGDPRLHLFLHQAVLAVSIISRLPRSCMDQLPFAYNYPLHLQASCPPELMPAGIGELITLRYDDWDNWLGRKTWRETIALDREKEAWLAPRARR